MTRSVFGFIIIVCTGLAFGAAMAADPDDATKAAKDILASLHAKQFDQLWEKQTSAFFKQHATKNSFLANMALGRQQLGAAKSSTFVDMAYSNMDPASGFKGEIYAFNYLSVYDAGKFYERIVVLKEPDGIFRMSGLFGAPAQP